MALRGRSLGMVAAMMALSAVAPAGAAAQASPAVEPEYRRVTHRNRSRPGRGITEDHDPNRLDAAIAKRERKNAKRRRDAERSAR